MKQKDIKELSTAEIGERIAEENAQLTKLKLNHAVSPIENPLKIRSTRRTIARLQTELNKRNSEGNNN
jgi:large subunit ribosomal protein L29